VFELDPNTALRWLSEAADHLKAFSDSFLREVHVKHIQSAELFAVVSEAQVGQGKAAAASESLPHSPLGLGRHRPPPQAARGPRPRRADAAMAQQLVQQVRQVLAPGCVPLFLSAGHKEYTTALLTHWGHWVSRPAGESQVPLPSPGGCRGQSCSMPKSSKRIGAAAWSTCGPGWCSAHGLKSGRSWRRGAGSAIPPSLNGLTYSDFQMGAT
jgi:hypothetical protein